MHLIESKCEICEKSLFRSIGETNKRIKRGLTRSFCADCAKEYGRLRFKRWNVENNPKEWHKNLTPRMDKHYAFKGECRRKDGYVRVMVESNNRQLLHRVIAEKNIGRALLQNEVVHHKDGNPSNNNTENLVVMDRHDHSRLHGLMKCQKEN